jgi:hypothetical protein
MMFEISGDIETKTTLYKYELMSEDSASLAFELAHTCFL